MIHDLSQFKQVDENYLCNKAKSIETKLLKKYRKSPDWTVILQKLNKSIITLFNNGCTIDTIKLKKIINEIDVEVMQ